MPALYCYATSITPADGSDLAKSPQTGDLVRGIYVGVSGNLSCVMADGSVAVFVAVPAGTVLPIRPNRVRATGTTATSLLALF